MKIGLHLPKLLSNIKWLTFLEHGVFIFTVDRQRKQYKFAKTGNDFRELVIFRGEHDQSDKIISNSRINGKTQLAVSQEIDSESLEEPLDANRLDSCGHRGDSAAEAVAGSTIRAGCKSVTSSLYEDTARPRGIIVYRTSSAVAEKPRDALCY